MQRVKNQQLTVLLADGEEYGRKLTDFPRLLSPVGHGGEEQMEWRDVSECPGLFHRSSDGTRPEQMSYRLLDFNTTRDLASPQAAKLNGGAKKRPLVAIGARC